VTFLLLGAIRWPTGRPPALLFGIASTASFLVVAACADDFGPELRRVVIADVVALLALSGAAALQRAPRVDADSPASSQEAR
jgi:hypothetical protein